MERGRIEPIEASKKTVAAIVQERIRDAILTGILPPASRIDQNQLAADLNVSLVPVREALKKLEGEGFVRIIPRRGAFITEVSVDDIEDLYFARSLLEGQAAYHAAEKLTDANLQQLDQLMLAMNQALAAHDYHLFIDYNRRFHFVIYNAAGSQYLSTMIGSLWELAERYRYRYLFLKDRAVVIQAEHQAILDACHTRNSKLLRDAIVHHMNQTLAGVRDFILAELNHTQNHNK